MSENVREREIDDYLDNETGEEKVVHFKVRRFSTDAETGEPDIGDKVVKRKTFQVPGRYLQRQQEECRPKRRRRTTLNTLYLESEVLTQADRRKILSAKQLVGPIVFMFPTLLVFPGWISILCMLCEACMHIWSHKRNKREQNAEVEYRSPLHLMTSQFCVHCLSQRWMEKIGEIQDKRTLRRKSIYQNVLRRVVQ